jgi:imidazolonepropionase-like amidohydrolase
VLQPQQNLEFTLRREFTSSFEILRSATSTNASLLNRSGELGVVAPNARADLLVLEGNPVEDLSVLERSAQTLQLIMKDGVIYKNTLE